MDLVRRTVRHTFRTMLKNPGMTLAALGTLALGIGANTAIFSIVNAFLLRPLPFKDPSQLVALYAVRPNFDCGPASYSEFEIWSDQNPVFSSVAGLFEVSFNLSGNGQPSKIEGAMVTEGYFETFGIAPLLGRNFTREEHEGDGHVAIVSERFWFGHLRGTSNIIGRTLTIDGLPFTVIGVMPERAPDFTSNRQTSVWIPFEPNHPMYSMNPAYHFVRVFGRLKAGITLQQAQIGMALVAKKVSRQYPFLRDTIEIVPLRDVVAGNLQSGLIFFLGGVIFLLLISCANIANLLMIRAANRRRELAIRSFLGASRRQLVQQILIESLVTNILGGSLGLLLCGLLQHWLLRLWPANIALPYELAIDWRVLAFTASITVTTAILFGLGPALIGSRVPPLELLSQGSTQAGVGLRQTRFCNFVVVAELSVAALLTVGAGLMVKSFAELQRVDPGFRAEGLMTARITLPEYEFRQGTALYHRIQDEIRGLPGVEAIGATTFLPLGSKDDQLTIRAEGQSFPSGHEPTATMQIISPGFFDAMRTPLLAGRSFTDRDTRDAPYVVIVNQTLAQRFWPGQIAIGKHLDSGLFGNAGWQEVVGVVGDTKSKSLDKPSELQIYLPYSEFSNLAMTLAVRASIEPSALGPTIEKAVASIHPGLPVETRTMEDVLHESLATQRTAAVLPSLFAICGLFLSCIGIYGVISYVVGQRTREIGIRMALGAGPGKVLSLVLRHGLRLSVTGAVIGIVAAVALTRILSKWLYGVKPLDLLTFVAASAVLLLVGAVATYIPARRATRLNPMVALREE